MKFKEICETCVEVGFIAIALGITFITGYGFGKGDAHHYYGNTAIVTDCDRDNDIVTVTDANGESWQFYGCDDYFDGDLISIVMDNNGTLSKKDDFVVSTSFAGYTADEVE